MGTFAANQQGIEGAVIQMLSHGVVSTALFLVVRLFTTASTLVTLMFMAD